MALNWGREMTNVTNKERLLITSPTYCMFFTSCVVHEISVLLLEGEEEGEREGEAKEEPEREVGGEGDRKEEGEDVLLQRPGSADKTTQERLWALTSGGGYKLSSVR